MPGVLGPDGGRLRGVVLVSEGVRGDCKGGELPPRLPATGLLERLRCRALAVPSTATFSAVQIIENLIHWR